MCKLILADGTELTGFTRNGDNFVSKKKVETAVFADNLSTLTISDEEGESETVLHNAELIQQVHYADGWYLCFRELTPQELQYAAINGKLDYLAMMTDVEFD